MPPTRLAQLGLCPLKTSPSVDGVPRFRATPSRELNLLVAGVWQPTEGKRLIHGRDRLDQVGYGRELVGVGRLGEFHTPELNVAEGLEAARRY